jgi:hypothetical protein
MEEKDFKTEEERQSFREGKAAAEEIWGTPRIKSVNIPPARKAGMSYKNLMQQMKNLTGAAPASPVLTPGMLNNALKSLNEISQYDWNNRISRNPNQPEPPKDHRLVVFYGFNGMLAHRFSVVTGMGHEEINARLMVAKNQVPYKIMYAEEFRAIAIQFPEDFQEVTFDDAMNIIRIGLQEVADDFEEAEVDEFDDNCVESCKPGEHSCGK